MTNADVIYEAPVNNDDFELPEDLPDLEASVELPEDLPLLEASVGDGDGAVFSVSDVSVATDGLDAECPLEEAVGAVLSDAPTTAEQRRLQRWIRLDHSFSASPHMHWSFDAPEWQSSVNEVGEVQPCPPHWRSDTISVRNLNSTSPALFDACLTAMIHLHNWAASMRNRARSEPSSSNGEE